MKRLITLGIGAALGYLLGSREGRQNLDRFAKNAQSFWNDPKTQEQVQRATSTVKEQAPVVAERAADLAGKASGAMGAVKDKAADVAGSVSEKAGTAEKSGGKHATDEASSSTTTVTTPSGDVLSDPSQSLESEGGGPARY